MSLLRVAEGRDGFGIGAVPPPPPGGRTVQMRRRTTVWRIKGNIFMLLMKIRIVGRQGDIAALSTRSII